MLNDVFIGRYAMGSNRMDMHRSATFHCQISAWSRRIASWFDRD